MGGARPMHDTQRGNVLVTVTLLLIVVAGFATALFYSTTSTSQATRRHVVETSLLYVAESGLSRNSVMMAADPLYAAKDTGSFTADATAQEYVGAESQMTSTNGKQHRFDVRVQYLNVKVPVMFADRSNPIEPWDEIKVVVRARTGSFERSVVGWYDVQMGQGFAAAIVSDMLPTGAGGGGKSGAQKGHISFDVGNQNTYVFGDLKANGEVFCEGDPLTPAVASAEMGAFAGTVTSNLAGTSEEIPNFTAAGGANQLFDFDRFEAAAAAGAGEVFTTVQDFADACRLANLGLRAPLEGVIVLKIDSAAEGGGPKLQDNLTSTGAAGINIQGTLCVRFSPGTDPSYKLWMLTPLNVNAADLSAWDPADQSTYTTGYPGTFTDPSKHAHMVTISPAYSDFTAQDDLPAVMFENGIVDTHDAVNVCGVVYGPSFIEIENKSGNVQYFNGTIIGGAGIYLQGHSGAPQAFRFDPNALDSLAVSASASGSLQTINLRGFSILQ